MTVSQLFDWNLHCFPLHGLAHISFAFEQQFRFRCFVFLKLKLSASINFSVFAYKVVVKSQVFSIFSFVFFPVVFPLVFLHLELSILMLKIKTATNVRRHMVLCITACNIKYVLQFVNKWISL